MLVLSRREGESIVIDGDIRVTVLKTKGRITRLGIEAPQEVRIRRSELYLRFAEHPSQISEDERRPAESTEFAEMGALICGRRALPLSQRGDRRWMGTPGWRQCRSHSKHREPVPSPGHDQALGAY